MFRKILSGAAIFLALLFAVVFTAHPFVHHDFAENDCPVCAVLHGGGGFSPAPVVSAPQVVICPVTVRKAEIIALVAVTGPLYPRAPPAL